jgi:simple sugar transport system permease protein
MMAGLFIAVIYAFSCIKFKADQVVSGAAINILMIGMPGFLSGAFFLSSGSTPQIPKDHLLPQSPVVVAIAVIVLVAVIWYVLYNTPFGLRLRSVGENPEAADAAGVSVSKIRYSGVLLAGILAGMGGAYLSIGQSSLFTRNMTAGRGFIALAALLFAALQHGGIYVDGFSEHVTKDIVQVLQGIIILFVAAEGFFKWLLRRRAQLPRLRA